MATDAQKLVSIIKSYGTPAAQKAVSSLSSGSSSSGSSSSKSVSSGTKNTLGISDTVTSANAGQAVQALSQFFTPTAKQNISGITSSISRSLSANEPINVEELSGFSGVDTKLPPPPTQDSLNNFGVGVDASVKATEQSLAQQRKEAETQEKDILKQFMNEGSEDKLRVEVPDEMQKMKEQARAQANQYKSQIDMINAQLQANLMQLRQTGSQEGVTEAVYGGQQNQLNREAAVKLMPLAALYQASLDNYQAAKEIVDDYIRQENQYLDRYWSWKNNVYDKAMQYADKVERRAVEDVRRAEDQVLSNQKEVNNLYKDVVGLYLSNGQKPPDSLAKYDLTSPTAMTDLMSYMASAPVKSKTGVSTRFTQTQLNNGASKAGKSLEEFLQYPEEVQNYFVTAKLTDIDSLFSTIGKAIDKPTKANVTKAQDAIDGAGLAGDVSDWLMGQLPTNLQETMLEKGIKTTKSVASSIAEFFGF
jgi:hypothetical protein